MYTTQINIQIERWLDREEEEVGTDRCIQQRTIDREIVRYRGGGGSYKQMYTTQINRQIVRELNKEEEEGVGTGGCILLKTINIQIERQFDREEEEEEVDTDRCLQLR